MIDWKPRAAALADSLAEGGWLDDPGWHAAFAAVPRHLFIPRFWTLDDDQQPLAVIDGSDPAQADTWLDAVYADDALITEWLALGGRSTPVSSASQPAVIALMLAALDLHAGQRVLEIGTGTGYTTALLCTRSSTVTSIDIDAELVGTARIRLTDLGHRPHLVAGDGSDGVPATAPYDRIIVTCAAAGIPPAWIEQLAPGGRIVSPMTFGAALAVVDRTGPDEVSGRFHTRGVGFIPLRSGDPVEPLPAVPVESGRGPRVATRLDLAAFASEDFRLWLSLSLPASRLMWLRAPVTSERTGVTVRDGQRSFTVEFDAATAAGSGDGLLDAVESAWRAWRAHGSPARARYGLTARASGEQYAWLDSSDGDVRWPLSG